MHQDLVVQCSICTHLFRRRFKSWEKALFRGKGALFGVVHTKNLGHHLEVALFGVALFEVLHCIFFKAKTFAVSMSKNL